MLLLLLIYVVLRTLWKIAVYLISTLVNKSHYYLVSASLYVVYNTDTTDPKNGSITDKVPIIIYTQE